MLTDSRYLVLIPTLLLYLPACACPAVYVDDGGQACTAIRLGTVNGLSALLMGWLPPWTIPWSANPLLLVGAILLLCRRAKAATYFGGAAATMGAVTWVYSWLGAWKGLEVGYFLWQASLIVFAVGAAATWGWQSIRRRRVLQAVPVDEEYSEALPVGSQVVE